MTEGTGKKCVRFIKPFGAKEKSGEACCITELRGEIFFF